MLFNCARLNLDTVKFSIVTKCDPSALTANLQPIIVFHCLLEFIFAAVMPFYLKRRPNAL